MMSKKSVARRPSAPSAQSFAAQDAVEAIALRIHQIASTAGVIAERLDDESLGHVLYFIEETLLDVETRVEALHRV
jgi:uncharacterized protein Smg (DUF494 family)